MPIRPLDALGTFGTLWPFRTIDSALAFHFFWFFRALWLVLREIAALIDSLRPVTPDNISHLNTQSVGNLTPTFPPVPQGQDAREVG